MALDSKHPLYDDRTPDWMLLRDCYEGERSIKKKGLTYLPATQGMTLDGMRMGQTGYLAYEAYKLRAVWHDLFKEAVESYLGLLHQKPPSIKLPKALEPLRTNASKQGESLEQLLRRINEEQLTTGRLGLLLDLPKNVNPSNPLPYIAMYAAEAVRNWDDGEDTDSSYRLNYVILDESGYTRTDNNLFDWTQATRYRLCQLGTLQTEDVGVYSTGLFEEAGSGTPQYDQNRMIIPMIRGTALNEIPFTFVNSKDLLSFPDVSPLLGLAHIVLAMYRGEADYRQNLFMQGQDTLVTIGSIQHKDVTDPNAPLRTGAGSRIEIEIGGEAKYIGVSGEGLEEQRMAISNDRQRAEVRAGQLINARMGDKESGEALRTRLGAQTATLRQIALTGGAALEKQLRFAAQWMGANPDEVEVIPNTEFTNIVLTGQDLSQLMDAKINGKLPISFRSLHAFLVDKGITKLSFEDELVVLEEEGRIKILQPEPEPKPAPTK